MIFVRRDERPCSTRNLNIHGYHQSAEEFGELAVYGSDALAIQQLMDDDPALAKLLHDRLPIRAAQVVFAVRHEMARTVEDVLSRRTRALVLDAKAAIEMAPTVARLMANELRPHPDPERLAEGHLFMEEGGVTFSHARIMAVDRSGDHRLSNGRQGAGATRWRELPVVLNHQGHTLS